MHIATLWLLIIGWIILLAATLICLFVTMNASNQLRNSGEKSLTNARTEMIWATILAIFGLVLLAIFTGYAYKNRNERLGGLFIAGVVILVLIPVFISTILCFNASSNLASSATGDHDSQIEWLVIAKIGMLFSSGVVLIGFLVSGLSSGSKRILRSNTVPTTTFNSNNICIRPIGKAWDSVDLSSY